jgi:alpha-glucosidase (family GH31 glycosyl hydrolase)
MPYLYSAAAESHDTGLPIVRALALEYPEVREYDEVKGTYLLGRDLLVNAFESEAVIPPGAWYEWSTGRKVIGPCRDKPTVYDPWGGGLYVRAGAVIPTWPTVSHCEKGWNEKVELLVWPHDGDGESRFELYEDDGASLDYLKGMCSRTEIVATTRGGKVAVVIGKRRGSFLGMGSVEFSTIEMCEGNGL